MHPQLYFWKLERHGIFFLDFLLRLVGFFSPGFTNYFRRMYRLHLDVPEPLHNGAGELHYPVGAVLAREKALHCEVEAVHYGAGILHCEVGAVHYRFAILHYEKGLIITGLSEGCENN